MTPQRFIAKWQANTRNERAACQEHFIDLCHLLGEQTPNDDPTGSNYAFEKGATKATGSEGWADVWRRERFAWEYKGKRKDLDAAHRQLLQYAGALGNPPLLVVSDISRITIRTNWTNAVSERHDVPLADIADPARLDLLRSVFTDPERLRPGKTRAVLTAEAASDFAELALRLRQRGRDPQSVAHFINRLVFCLFADDVGLLPPGLFERMLDASSKLPARFEANARKLFAAMAQRGGEIDFTPIAWFNGGLFDGDAALPLEADDVALLQRAAALDWADIDPSILGTLFERGLDPDKRSQLGAHYTSRDMIERLIEPVIRRPLAEEWQATRERIAGLLATAAAARRAKAIREAETLFRAFLDRLRAFRVLDPACGSGNFLYLALLALKDLEHRAMVEAEALGLQREFPQVGPEAVLGLEINPYAAELARVSVWIGHIQWARRHGFSAPSDPVLRTLDTIACRDAVLADDGSQAAWPTTDVILGNPPFLGDKAMIAALGQDYVRRLRTAYAGSVPGGADLVCYWFERARSQVANGRTIRAGLVATNSIRGGANRRVLERVIETGRITNAWPDNPWALDGAAVRVSLICFDSSTGGTATLEGLRVPIINADLTAGVDLTRAHALFENENVAFSGTTKKGAFDLPADTARSWLQLPSNPNGRPNADVLAPWMNGEDVTGRSRGMWIINFGDMLEAEAAYYAVPFSYVSTHVKPARMTSSSPMERRDWWKLARRAPAMFTALKALQRFIVTPEVSKHRVFTWCLTGVTPDKNLVVIARSDDTSFGILHSRFHEVWALRMGSSLEDRPRYTVSTTLRTFPFPDGLTPDRSLSDYASDPRAMAIAQAAQALVTARDRWLNPAELVHSMPEVVAGFPDRMVPKNPAAAVVLRKRTLTALYNTRGTPEGAWLDSLHATLDAAVAAAYGWPADLPDEDVLARLLALNHQRASATRIAR